MVATMTYQAHQKGQGVAFQGYKLPKGVARRIEELGKLNDRRLACRSARDKYGLLELAACYAEKDMPLMAAEITKEAESL